MYNFRPPLYPQSIFPNKYYYNNYCSRSNVKKHLNTNTPYNTMTNSLNDSTTASKANNSYEIKKESEPSSAENKTNNFKQCSTRSVTTENNNIELFEIFGLKIYFDDLLLICILLFLYQEGVKDEYLFISLILLLLN